MITLAVLTKAKNYFTSSSPSSSNHNDSNQTTQSPSNQEHHLNNNETLSSTLSSVYNIPQEDGNCSKLYNIKMIILKF